MGALANVAVSEEKGGDSAPKYPLGERLKAWWLGQEPEGTQGESAPKYPLGVRLRSWWRGEEPEGIFTQGHFEESDDPDRTDGRQAPTKKASKIPEMAKTGPYWTPARVTAAQMVWGQGFATPGDQRYLTNLVNVAGLNPDMSILDLSAGLGGAARALSERFGGLWITALETSPELAKAGMEQSTMAGMAKKVPLQSFDPAKPAWKKKFDLAFARESFYQLEKKEVLLLAIAKSLKPTGQCLFTDLVVREEGLSSPALDAWMGSEPSPVYPWSVEQYRAFFDKLKLPVSLSPLDLTEDYCTLVVDGWWNAQNTILRAKQSGNYDEQVLAALIDEVGRWAARTAALQSGDLSVYRFYSDKRRR